MTKTQQSINQILNSNEILDNKTRLEMRKILGKRGIAPKPPKIKIMKSAKIDNLPPKIKAIILRAEHDPQFLEKLEEILKKAANFIITKAAEQETFCDYFRFPANLDQLLLKLYGITETELRQEMAKINFHPSNRLLNHPFHQTLMIAYAIGLYLDREDIRILALLPITVRIWNSRIKAAFKYGCNPDIARYVQKYMLKNNSYYKNFKTPLNFLLHYFIISKDKEFASYIRQDAADPVNGLVKMLKTIQPGLYSLINKTLAGLYYKAYEQGLKETVAGDKDDSFVEKVNKSDIISQILDKFEKNRIIKHEVLMNPKYKQILKDKFALSDKAIKKLDEFFENEKRFEDLKLIIEFLLNELDIQSVDEFCLMKIDDITRKIGNTKKRDSHFQKIKEYRIRFFNEMFGRNPTNNQTDYRLLNIILYSTILYIKALTC